jgi:alanine-synthesizing transaminase
MFSRRTQWDASSNTLTEILEARRASGRRVIDLTVSNPTRCGFTYPEERVLRALSGRESLAYRPDPHGLLPAREAIAEYYRTRGIDVSPDDLFITASTSESYSLLFRLLCNPEDSVVLPTPAYPLFEYLAGVNDVRTEYYRLVHSDRWRIDPASLSKAMVRSAKAVLVVDPNNPTGMFLSGDERKEVAAAASGRGAALIVDEVFCEYRFNLTPGPGMTDPPPRPGAVTPASGAYQSDGLTFLLNGLSKMAAMPQMKIGWIAIGGEPSLRSAARSKLEILNDIYLSANTPAMAALPELLDAGIGVRAEIVERISANFTRLKQLLDGVAGCSVLPAEGGWNAVVRLPGGIGDGECAEGLLDEAGVYCYPGYFFNFEEEDVVVVSLLPRQEVFTEGVTEMAGWIASAGGMDGAPGTGGPVGERS